MQYYPVRANSINFKWPVLTRISSSLPVEQVHPWATPVPWPDVAPEQPGVLRCVEPEEKTEFCFENLNIVLL